MYNRKFNIKKDFSALNEMQNKILPICNEIADPEEIIVLKNYIRQIFFNQYKK